MESRECQVCGSKVREGDTICRTCGSTLNNNVRPMMNPNFNNNMGGMPNNNMPTMINPNFNNIVHEFVCPNCGVRIPDSQIHQFVRCSANNQYMNQNMNNSPFNNNGVM